MKEPNQGKSICIHIITFLDNGFLVYSKDIDLVKEKNSINSSDDNGTNLPLPNLPDDDDDEKTLVENDKNGDMGAVISIFTMGMWW